MKNLNRYKNDLFKNYQRNFQQKVAANYGALWIYIVKQKLRFNQDMLQSETGHLKNQSFWFYRTRVVAIRQEIGLAFAFMFLLQVVTDISHPQLHQSPLFICSVNQTLLSHLFAYNIMIF